MVIYNKEGGQVEMACQAGSRRTHVQTTSRVQVVCVVLNQSPILNCGEADQICSYVQALSNLSSNRSVSICDQQKQSSNQLPMCCLSSSVHVKVMLSAVSAVEAVGHASSCKCCRRASAPDVVEAE